MILAFCTYLILAWTLVFIIMPVFSIADAALNKVSWPVAFAIRKAAEGNPDIQQVFAQAAKVNTS